MSSKLCLTISLLLPLLCLNFEVQAQHKYTHACPDYMELIQYTPVTYLGFTKATAEIVLISYGNSEVDGKYTVGVGFFNSSDKTIKTLKLHWYLFHMDAWQNTKDVKLFTENEILTQGKTPIIETNEFRTKEKFETEVKLPCEQISSEVGNLANDKDLVMEFVVSEILYGDGTSWNRK
jgi:hypothetical protein